MVTIQSATAGRLSRTTEFPLSPREFAEIASLLRREAGIALADSKLDMVEGRLGRRLRVLRLNSFADYLDLVNGPDGSDEQRLLINALTTNLSGFFREAHHFEFLAKTILPLLVQRQQGNTKRLRIWSAGCSSGEEPYSIAMTVTAGLADLKLWDARILATDIDTDMVTFALNGRYHVDRVEPVPDPLRRRFLLRADGNDEVEVTDALRTLIAFRQLNLLQAWPMGGPFDVIFCRNVVIYFDKDTQRSLFDRFADMLIPGGWLFIGHSESLFRISDRFDHLGRTIYRTRS